MSPLSPLPEKLPLPHGRSCDDCAHFARCRRLQLARSGQARCEFWPSRYRPEVQPAPPVVESYYPRHASPGARWAP